MTNWSDKQGTAHPIDPECWQWQDRAACVGVSQDTFFFTEGDPKGQLGRARAMCADCPVFMECLEFATFTMPQGWGVWAGSTPDDRRLLREGTLTPDDLYVQCQDAKLVVAKEKHG